MNHESFSGILLYSFCLTLRYVSGNEIKIFQYHGCWCPLHCQDISSHGTDWVYRQVLLLQEKGFEQPATSWCQEMISYSARQELMWFVGKWSYNELQCCWHVTTSLSPWLEFDVDAFQQFPPTQYRITRDHSGYGISQREKALHNNAFSHRLGQFLEWCLITGINGFMWCL